MAPGRKSAAEAKLRSVAENDAASSSAISDRPGPSVIPGSEAATTDPLVEGSKKKKKHRAGKKRHNRRQSFAAHQDETDNTEMEGDRPSLLDSQAVESANRESFYRLGAARNHSNTSLESEALLDHRDSLLPTPRRQSVQKSGISASFSRSNGRSRHQSNFASGTRGSRLSRVQHQEESDEDEDDDERTGLLSSSYRNKAGTPRGTHHGSSYGLGGSPNAVGAFGTQHRRRSVASSVSSRKRGGLERNRSFNNKEDWDVNNPPSVPNSPRLGPDIGYDDVMLAGDDSGRGRSPDRRAKGDMLIDIDRNDDDGKSKASGSPTTPLGGSRPKFALLAEEDVCFPQEDISEMADEDERTEVDTASTRARRRRRRRWPDLRVLEGWAIEEKEERTMEEGLRNRKVAEPLMIGGRLRPKQVAWHRDNDDTGYRFTYFNEEFQNTVHASTISELLQPQQSFRDLFVPEPPLIEDSSSSSSESEDDRPAPNGTVEVKGSVPPSVRSPTPSDAPTRASRAASQAGTEKQHGSSNQATGQNTPQPAGSKSPAPKTKRYGPRPVFWLDVLNPTDTEMKVISKAFGIHPLTTEDIMMQEAREKVELFRHYYFVAYRSFEQDANSEDYLEPVNMYVVVFREGVITFHFSQTPHPANVRRRIRQLSDYLFLTTDWISYAIIDDITDAYAPLIQHIEEDVDNIDEMILALHAAQENDDEKPKIKATDKNYEYEKQSEKNDKTTGDNGGHMLRRVGETRKKVMSLYRLLGNKADVIKGFAKRCNEQWEIAPRSEIGLYLGDIQDHIVTMTANLSHYENLLSRAHSNYLAQINIRMNERAEQTNDVLGKLTVLGTIVLPMNIVTGLWGMNCLVPGQDGDNLVWFWGLTGGLFAFGICCYLIAKRLYGIV